MIKLSQISDISLLAEIRKLIIEKEERLEEVDSLQRDIADKWREIIEIGLELDHLTTTSSTGDT